MLPAYLTTKAIAASKLGGLAEVEALIRAGKLTTRTFEGQEVIVAHGVLEAMREQRANAGARVTLAKTANEPMPIVFTTGRQAEDHRIVAAALASLAAPTPAVASTPPVLPPALKPPKRKSGLFRECISVAEAMKRTGKTEMQIRDFISRSILDTNASGEIPAFQVNHFIPKMSNNGVD